MCVLREGCFDSTVKSNCDLFRFISLTPVRPTVLSLCACPALPVMVVAVFDKMLPADFLQDNPTLYQRQKHTAFDPMIFSGWIFRSFMHGVIIFFIPYASIGIDNNNQHSGRADGLWFFASAVYYCTVMTPTLLILFDMANVNFLSWMSVLLSVAALFIVTLIMNFMTTLVPDLAGIITTLYATASFWMVLLLTVGICLIIEMFWRAAMREMYPTVVQIYQEINRLSKADQRRALDPANLLPPERLSDHHSASSAPTLDENIHVEYSVSMAPNHRKDRQNSVSHIGHANGADSSRGRDKLKSNLVRAMLRFRVRNNKGRGSGREEG